MILYDAAITDVVNFIPPPETWENCLRAIKPGAHLLAFCSTANHHRNTAYIEDAGFEIRDCIAWVFDDGGGSIVSPGMDLIAVARKPLECKTVAANVLKWGTGALNIDGCRVVSSDKPSACKGTGWAAQDKKNAEQGYRPSAYYDGQSGVEYKPHDQGRWPANVILEGSEKVVGLFPESKGASSQNNNSSVNIYKGDSLNHSKTKLNGFREWYNDSGSAARFFFQAGPDGPRPSAPIAYLHRLITPPGGTAYDPVTLDPWPTPMVECSGNPTH